MRTKKAIKNLLSSLFLQFIMIVSNFIIPRIIVLNYGSDTNGLINSIVKFLGYICILETGLGGVVKAKLYKALAKKNNEEISELMIYAKNFFKKISYVLILYVVILLFLYPTLVAYNFDFLFTQSLILVLALNLFMQYYFGIANTMLISADQKSYVVNVIKSIVTIISTIVMVLLMNNGVSIQYVEVCGSLILIIAPLLYNYYVNTYYKIDWHGVNTKKVILEQRWDGFYHSISSFVHSNTDIFILTIFTKFYEISVYSVYSLVTSGIKSMLAILTNSLSATFGNIYANNEKTKLKDQFEIFDYFHMIVVIIVFSIAAIFITPFVKLYVSNISDINYDRFLFGILIVLAEEILTLNNSYFIIIFAAGHYKQTKNHGFVECILNVTFSLLLFSNFGIVGLAIGTLVGVLYRLIASITYVNSNLIELNIPKLIKKYLINFGVAFLFILIFLNILKYFYINTYFDFIIQLVVCGIIFTIVILFINFVCFRDDFVFLVKNYFKKVLIFKQKRKD